MTRYDAASGCHRPRTLLQYFSALNRSPREDFGGNTPIVTSFSLVALSQTGSSITQVLLLFYFLLLLYFYGVHVCFSRLVCVNILLLFAICYKLSFILFVNIVLMSVSYSYFIFGVYRLNNKLSNIALSISYLGRWCARKYAVIFVNCTAPRRARTAPRRASVNRISHGAPLGDFLLHRTAPRRAASVNGALHPYSYTCNRTPPTHTHVPSTLTRHWPIPSYTCDMYKSSGPVLGYFHAYTHYRHYTHSHLPCNSIPANLFTIACTVKTIDGYGKTTALRAYFVGYFRPYFSILIPSV